MGKAVLAWTVTKMNVVVVVVENANPRESGRLPVKLY